MLRTSWALLIALLLAACAPGYSVRTSVDAANAFTSVRLQENVLGGGCPGCAIIELNIHKVTHDDRPLMYYDLVVQYRAKEWLLIEPGESLTLLVDGQPLVFTSDNGSTLYRTVAYGGEVLETAYYSVDLPQLRRIANATEVQVRLDGSETHADRTFQPANLGNFRRFLEEHGE